MTPRRWDPDIQGGDWVIIALLAVAVVALVCSVFSPQLTASVSAVVSTAFGGASGYASRTSRLRRDDAVRVTDDALGELRGLESLRKIEEGKHDDEVFPLPLSDRGELHINGHTG